jgi:hypothetical protein
MVRSSVVELVDVAVRFEDEDGRLLWRRVHAIMVWPWERINGVDTVRAREARQARRRR